MRVVYAVGRGFRGSLPVVLPLMFLVLTSISTRIFRVWQCVGFEVGFLHVTETKKQSPDTGARANTTLHK